MSRRRTRLLSLLISAALVLGGCSGDGTDEISATKKKPVEDLAAVLDTTTTTALPDVSQPEALNDAIAKEDDVVPVLTGPAVARSGGRPASRGGTAARTPAAAPAGRAVAASGGGSGPWAPGPDAPKQWAVLVGVSKYQKPTKPTVGSAGDVAAIVEAMRRAGWDRSHIKTLVDGEATGSAIRAAMQWLVERSGPDTFTVFHYSGHVKQKSVGQEFLWSVDNQFIPNTEFGDVMRRLQGRAWVDVAGCEAGGFEQGIPSPTRLFTASSRVTEKSYEHPDWKQSIWTGLTVAQGMLEGLADANKDGVVTIQEAARRGQQRAPELTRSQPKGPQHPIIAGGDPDGWILGRPAPPPPPPPPPSQNTTTTTAPPQAATPPTPCVGAIGLDCR